VILPSVSKPDVIVMMQPPLTQARRSVLISHNSFVGARRRARPGDVSAAAANSKHYGKHYGSGGDGNEGGGGGDDDYGDGNYGGGGGGDGCGSGDGDGDGDDANVL